MFHFTFAIFIFFPPWKLYVVFDAGHQSEDSISQLKLAELRHSRSCMKPHIWTVPVCMQLWWLMWCSHDKSTLEACYWLIQSLRKGIVGRRDCMIVHEHFSGVTVVSTSESHSKLSKVSSYQAFQSDFLQLKHRLGVLFRSFLRTFGLVHKWEECH